MLSTNDAPRSNRSRAVALNRAAFWVCKHWIVLFSVLFGLYVGLPLLAPVFMAAGITPLGRLIYAIYSFLCHQLPERSFFFFGPKIMYPLAEIQSQWQVTDNALILRQFTGAPGLGWKVAWSDRMVAMFTGMLPFAWLWWPLRKKARAISWKALLLFLLPMALDGTTHFISDLAGLHHGFRDSNAWLAMLTQNSLPASFYSGDAWGSFNSITRLASGVLFAIGIVWFGFPHLDGYFQEQAAWIRYKFERANLKIS